VHWPKTARAYFWQAVNDRQTHFWPEYFLSQTDGSFMKRTVKNWKIWYFKGKFSRPDPTLATKKMTQTNQGFWLVPISINPRTIQICWFLFLLTSNKQLYNVSFHGLDMRLHVKMCKRSWQNQNIWCIEIYFYGLRLIFSLSFKKNLSISFKNSVSILCEDGIQITHFLAKLFRFCKSFPTKRDNCWRDFSKWATWN